ncbi:hypothetical protein [Curtobacterium luteum]|uniref:Secreted protein n=1 Tax=Curtobacterium luteum TaxID=33881 RepID=A0A175S2R7_9MICO|nr:hypothetical protein [Curtobacterium luteum]KTR11751.1 hypothetical protein NS184_00840 [Curtobacterium luteum]
MTTRTTALSTLAAVLLLPAILAGCSSTPTDAETESATGSRNDAALAIASCMRDRGHDYADPDTSGGRAPLQIPDGVDPDAYQSDLRECIGAAGGGAGSGQAAQAAPGATEADEAYAACLTEAGFDDFPDDVEEWNTYAPADQDAFDAASSTCGDDAYGDLASEMQQAG